MMVESIIDNHKKRRGRPATGITPMVGVRLEPDFRTEIEAWAATQDDTPVLAEAIRRLIRHALDKPKARKPPADPAGASRPATGAMTAPPKKTRPRRS
jgi:hypothetical protein